ncbi:MAG: hypothetical protein HFJ55_05910 [Clostridia bacterium]|nr:hypothetical protein [Clostridia bacterium]
MKKETIKKLLALFIILCIIIVVTIVILVMKKSINGENNEEHFEEEMGDAHEDEFEEEWFKNAPEIEISSGEYLTIKHLMQQYINYITPSYSLSYSRVEDEEDEEDGGISENQRGKLVYDILSKEYINEKSITEDNILQSLGIIEKANMVTILQMKKLENTDNVTSFALRILIQDVNDYSMIKETYLMVSVDDMNSTYSIEPVQANNIDDIKIKNKIDKIEPNDNNLFSYGGITDADVLKEYINRYKRIVQISPKFVYNNILDNEYRQKRFGSEENFEKYVNNNKEMIKNIELKKYQTNANNSNFLQYVAIDQNGKYYIFKERSMVDCKIMLDTYTVDILDFIEKYDSVKEGNKAALNVNKIIEAVNNKDYDYIYSKLDDNFKKSNFNNVGKFENFVKNKFYENNTLKNVSSRQEGNTYIITAQISDYNDSITSREITIIMRLLDNRDYVISISQ